MKTLSQSQDRKNPGRKSPRLGLQPSATTAPNTGVFESPGRNSVTGAVPVAARRESIAQVMPLAMFIGRLVTVPFREPDGIVESRAVRIDSVAGDQLVGVLKDEGFFYEEIQRGHTVAVNRSQIDWVELTEDEWLRAVEDLRRHSCFANSFLGQPMGSDFQDLHRKRFGPQEALEWWRDFDPIAIDDEPFIDA
jgi:hypothetical protein